jgi:glyceraldehyde 3-phosphate dehydrogenase
VDPALLAYLLKYDTTHRKFQGEVAVDGNSLIVGNQKIALSANTDPSTLALGRAGGGSGD